MTFVCPVAVVLLRRPWLPSRRFPMTRLAGDQPIDSLVSLSLLFPTILTEICFASPVPRFNC